MTVLYDNHFNSTPSPSPFAYYSDGYASLEHITANGEHFIRSGGPNKDYGIDSNHSPGLLNLLCIISASAIGGTGRLRGGNVKLIMRANELYLPNPARIALLVQSNDKRSAFGAGSIKNINSVQVNDLICEQIGVARPVNRLGGTSGDQILTISEWTEVNIPLSDNPADWIYMPPAGGHEGSYIDKADSTAVLDGGLINIMVVALFNSAMPTYEFGSVEGYAPADQGTIDFDRIIIEDGS